MRKTILNQALFCLFLSIPILSSSQKAFQGKAYYQTKTSVDMSNFGSRQLSEERKKQIADRMKSALEKTYLLTFNQFESVFKEEERLETPGQSNSMRFRMMSSDNGLQYKNIKNQLILKEQDFMGKQFLVKDSLPVLEWQLSNETKQIGKYTCFKATAKQKAPLFDINRFRRPSPSKSEVSKDSTKAKIKEDTNSNLAEYMVVTAWYTPQIPINQGPSSYWGLPGLILEINADRTTMLCSKIILNPKQKETIKVPSKGKEISQKEYDAIVTKKTEEMREVFKGRGGRGGGRRSR